MTNSGYYQLEGDFDATNSAGVAYSTAVQLTVDPTPAPAGNLIVSDASQLGWGGEISDTNFVPTWDPPLTNSLIAGETVELGQVTIGAGNFGEGNSNFGRRS